MRIVKATFVNNEVEPGWTILDDNVPFGKHYLVDLDRVENLTMINTDTGKEIRLDCIWALHPTRSGFLPLMAFKIEES